MTDSPRDRARALFPDDDSVNVIRVPRELLAALCDDLDALTAKVARLREALRPFAEACIDGELGDAFIGAGLDEAVMAARAALDEETT